MKIVCFSGLGADERMFSRLTLDYPLIHIPWRSPKPKESIAAYAHRLTSYLPTDGDWGMLGLSFGGVVAQELAGKLNPKFLVLISTLEHAEELPWYYRTFKALPEATPMAQLAPIAPKFLFNKVFGASDVATQELLHNTITSADPAFIRWAVYHILRYRKDETNYSGPTLRIHGSQDHLISCPAGLPSSNCIKGGHLMIYEQAEEVSEVVNRFIKENLRFLRGS